MVALEAEECACRDFPLCRHVQGRHHRLPWSLWREALRRWSPEDYGDRGPPRLPPLPVLATEDATRAARVALYERLAEARQEMPYNEARIAEAERRACR